MALVFNHEVWVICEICGEEYDARLWDKCPYCNNGK